MEIARQDESVLQLQGDMHISDLEELRGALIRTLKAGPAMVLDLSGVDRCDTASLQILYSLRRSAERDGKELSIFGLSTAIREAGASLGFSL
jgi:anti-anti-sigma factor